MTGGGLHAAPLLWRLNAYRLYVGDTADGNPGEGVIAEPRHSLQADTTFRPANCVSAEVLTNDRTSAFCANSI